ncbi:hypothetical protein [Nocardioides zeae]
MIAWTADPTSARSSFFRVCARVSQFRSSRSCSGFRDAATSAGICSMAESATQFPAQWTSAGLGTPPPRMVVTDRSRSPVAWSA